MKKLKKIISVFIGIVMLINITLCSVTVVSAKKYNGFIYKVKNNKVIITEYTGNEVDIVVPSEIEGKPVTEIDDYAFDRNINRFRSLEIPSSVKEIGSNVYSEYGGNHKLEKLILHEGLEYVGEWAFDDCEKLKNVKIPKSVKSIHEAAFGIAEADYMYYTTYWYTDNFILDCYKGSEGEKYARRMNLDYRLIDKNPNDVHQSLEFSYIYSKTNKKETYLYNSYWEVEERFFLKKYNYTGKSIEPVSHIKIKSPITGRFRKINKSDYEITYKNNKNVGFAKAIIKGTNNFYGKVVINYRICPPKTKVTSIKNLGEGYVKINWKKTDKTTGYKIRYSTNNGKTFKTSEIIKNPKSTSQIIKLKKNKPYQIKVIPYYRVKKSKYNDKVYFNGKDNKRFNTIGSHCINVKKIKL